MASSRSAVRNTLKILKPFRAISGAFRTLRRGAGYIGAEVKRWSKNWQKSSGSPDGELIADLPELRRRSRDLYKNNAIGGGAIDLLVNNIIGRGLKMQAALDRTVIARHNNWSDDEAALFLDNLEHRLERRFKWFAESIETDSRGVKNFYEIQRLAMNSILQSGEVFATLPLRRHLQAPFKLRVGLIESDQVQSPYGVADSRTNRDGVITTPNGKPIGYWINKNQEQYPQEFVLLRKDGKYSGRPLVLHLYKTLRPGQSRGVPLLTRCMQEIKKLADYKKSEITAAEVASWFTAFITTETGELENSNRIVSNAGEQIEEDIKEEGVDYNMAPGMIMGLKPGEGVTLANPLRPNASYDAFVTAMMREIGMATGIPYELLVRHFTASFSASRAARVEFQKVINVDREWFVLKFCKPVYKEWFIDEVLSKRIEAPGFFQSTEVMQAYLGTIWAGEAMGMIDPQKEVDAAWQRVFRGFSNMTQESAEMTGLDYSRNVSVLEREAKLRKTHNIESELDIPPKTTGQVIGTAKDLQI